MAKKILREVEIWFPKLKKPSSFRGSEVSWSLQMRTMNEDQADDWEAKGFTVKKIKPNRANGEDFEPYWRANIKRKLTKSDGTERPAPEVKDRMLADVDPMTIGNGTTAHIKYTPWELEKDGQELSGRILEGIQIINLVPYTPSGDGEYEEDESFDLIDEDDDYAGGNSNSVY
jgi:hypothetical protein